MVKQVENEPEEPKVVIKEVTKKLPDEAKNIFKEALKHAKRAGKKVPDVSEFF